MMEREAGSKLSPKTGFEEKGILSRIQGWLGIADKKKPAESSDKAVPSSTM